MPQNHEAIEIMTSREQELIKKVVQGLNADEVMTKFGWVFEKLENEIFKDFKQLNPIDYQKFDNNRFLVLSLKMRVIDEMKSCFNRAISDGMIAQEDLEKKGKRV